MKFKSLIAVAAIVICAYSSAQAAQKDTLRVLAIGNSFSQDAVEQNLFEIAAEKGKVLIIGNMYIGGCQLERHWNNALTDNRDYAYRKIAVDGIRREHKGTTLDEAIRDERWDMISFQQASGKSGMPESYEPYLEDLINYVRERAPQAEFMWHQTWAYAKDAVHNDFRYYDCDQMYMYARIMRASAIACERYSLRVIPSGTAIQNLRATVDGDNCTRDGYHLNHTIGRYTAALTWFETISGISVEDVSYRPKGLSARRAKLACQSAHAAVSQPFAVTDLGLGAVQPPLAQSWEPAGVLLDANGRRISGKRAWNQKRETLIEDICKRYIGTAPEYGKLSCKLISKDSLALEGRATRKEVRIFYNTRKDPRFITLLVYTPNACESSPVFLGINRSGNESVAADPAITRADNRQLGRYGTHRILPRGSAADEWQLERLISEGYGLATFCADDAAPDSENSGVLGIRPHYADSLSWGTYGQLAWALGKAMDYLESDANVSKVALLASSHYSTPALWAAANDSRFALVALLRPVSSRIGDPAAVQHRFCRIDCCPNACTFCPNDALVLPRPEAELFALVAPRPLFISAASDISWLEANANEAAGVYRLWGRKSEGQIHFSATSEPCGASVAEDWSDLLKFAAGRL